MRTPAEFLAPMSPRSKQWLKRLSWLVPLIGSALTVGARQVDVRYVHRSDYEFTRTRDSLRSVIHNQRDSMDRANTNAKLDEAITRLMQIQCGERINMGCR